MYFDFDEWPAVHGCSDEAMKPYNGNVFLLRRQYGLIFKEKKFRSMDVSESGGDEFDVDLSKMHKIKYEMNLLPMCAEYITGGFFNRIYHNEGISFM